METRLALLIEIGERLRRIRMMAGLSRDDLAKLSAKRQFPIGKMPH
jgi:transcriptional regulator with XRE-family HTH domain